MKAWNAIGRFITTVYTYVVGLPLLATLLVIALVFGLILLAVLLVGAALVGIVFAVGWVASLINEGIGKIFGIKPKRYEINL